MVKHLENENMKEIIKEGVWVVDFYAEWCGPCKMLGPVLEQLQENVLKINVDNHESLAQEYGVMSIPTICFFKDGELKNKVVGFRSKEEIEKLIASI
ncbi:MAG: thioredoxin [Bacilli bacterium]|jgi:thioredoxin 1|nr:thioredoxin [Bacilli bacterium]